MLPEPEGEPRRKGVKDAKEELFLGDSDEH
jgi:hypothetical protein